MSAIAQSRSIYSYPARGLSAVELLRAIGHVTWTAKHEESALSAIAAALLRSPGLTGFRFEPSSDRDHLPIYEVTKPSSGDSEGSALAAASANGHNWGQVRVFFEARALPISESPLRLAKFVGQQLGILFHRLALQRDRERENGRITAIDRITRRRKTIHRAISVLCEQRNVARLEASSLLVQYARRNKKNLLEIAESLIFGFTAAAFTRPTLRRLSPAENTPGFFQKTSA